MAAVAARRSLGAPILFSIGGTGIGVWRVGAEGAAATINADTRLQFDSYRAHHTL